MSVTKTRIGTSASPVLKAMITAQRVAARKAHAAWGQGIDDARKAEAITRDDDIAAVRQEAAQRHEDLTEWEIGRRADIRAEVRNNYHEIRLSRLRSDALAARRSYETVVDKLARDLAVAAVKQQCGEGR